MIYPQNIQETNMKCTSFYFTISLCLIITGCATAPVTQAPMGQDGYVSLFDGSGLQHWDIVGSPAGWTVFDNGVLHSDGGKGGNWIRSKKQYSDFILELDYNLSAGGNSGVFIRCARTGRSSMTGMECQISNENRDDLHCTGSLYRYIAPDPRPDETPNVWHHYKITCIGKQIKIEHDGVVCIDINLDDHEDIKDKPLSGYIGLQDSHTGPGKWVKFKNIRIQEV